MSLQCWHGSHCQEHILRPLVGLRPRLPGLLWEDVFDEAFMAAHTQALPWVSSSGRDRPSAEALVGLVPLLERTLKRKVQREILATAERLRKRKLSSANKPLSVLIEKPDKGWTTVERWHAI